MNRPILNPDELIIMELWREREHLQRAIRPLRERLEQINARLRVLCAKVDSERVAAGNR